MKRWQKPLSLLLILGVIGIFGVPSLLNYQLPHAETQQLKERKIVRTIVIGAVLKPMDIIRFSFDQPVVVSEYFVKKGRSVGRNIPLFQLSKEAGMPQAVNEQATSWQEREQAVLLEIDQLKAEKGQLDRELAQLNQTLEQNTQQVEELESLFSLGLVAQSELKAAVRAMETTLQGVNATVERKRLSDASRIARIESLDNELEKIRKELGIVDSLVAGFYLDEEGNAYSQESGFVLNKNAENERISSNQSILELALIDDFQRLEMIGSVEVEDIEYIDVGLQLQIDTDTENHPFRLEVTDISQLVEHGLVEITMKLTKEPDGKFSIGTIYTGRVERVLSEKSTYAIPFSAIVEEDFQEDEMVNIYYLDKEERIFYDRYFVRQLRAKTKAIGDREVLIQIETDEIDLDQVEIVTNPGYKIFKDARVLP